MSSELKHIALRGLFWNAVDKLGVQSWNFIIGLLLARILLPEDFGLIGMLAIFMAIAQSLVESGMASGLIQKKEKKDEDFSTVFVFNMGVSVGIYGILFLSAPLIASFYNKPELTLLTRVLCLSILINAFSVVHRTKLSILLDFKTPAKVNAIAVITSAIVAFYLAYKGHGVWALVGQQLTSAATATLALGIMGIWKPSVTFSQDSFKALFGFGSKLLAAGIYSQVMNQVYNIIIGKAYPTAQLGFYTRAREFSDLPAGVVTSIINQVSYPLLASIQDEKERMIMVFRRLVRLGAFINFPLMTLLALLADPFITWVLPPVWKPTVPLLQWVVFSRLLFPLSSINLNILNAVGRSDLFLKVDLSKLPIVILALIITIPLGIKAMVIGQVISGAVAYGINTFMPGRLFGFGLWEQIKEIKMVILATCIMAACVYVSIELAEQPFIKLMLGGITGGISYLLITFLFNMKEMEDIKDILKKIKNRK
ncbi:MAG: lipopolysaccharide biosynthesis protein [Flavobacteriales bacterium]|nr:lipopolysaccharide biosynthesis protein [Flavobacteriales bacterium]